MTTITTNPVPPGRYWMDIIGEEKLAKFAGAIKGLNEAHPGIFRIIGATRHLANEARDYAESDLTGVLVGIWETLAGRISETPERDWVLFEVTSPMIWDFDIGAPTVAPPNVTAEVDTIQRPEPEKEPADKIADAVANLPSFGTAAKVAVSTLTLVAVGAGVFLLLKFRRR